MEGLQIMHLNDRPEDNQVGNLKQGTALENARMGWRLRKGTSWIPKQSPSYTEWLIHSVLKDEYAEGKYV